MSDNIGNSSHFRKWLILFAVCFPLMSSGQDLIFHGEQIEIEVRGDSCSLTGIYQFRNDSDREIFKTLSYPFPVQDDLPFPHLTIILDDKGNTVDFLKQSNNILFPVRVAPKSSRNYTIQFTQMTPNNFFEYILDTSRQWHFPIASATFDIIIPNNLKILEIQPDGFQQIQQNSENLFRMSCENFRSDQNLLIKWSQL